MTPHSDAPSGRTPESLPEGAADAGKDIADDGRSLKDGGSGDDGRLQGDEAVQEDEFGDGI